MMGVVTKIAFRNLKEHRSKTLIVGSLITLGIAVLVVGNSFMDSVNAGIEESYIHKYTGNIIISSSKVESPSLSLSRDLMENTSPVIPGFQEVRAHVQAFPEVESTTGQITGAASLEWGDFGEGFSVLLGVDPLSYQGTFPEGVNILEGRFLKPNEQGIVLSLQVAEMLEDSAGRAVEPGDSILVKGMNEATGMKIREVEVRGIHDYGEAAPDLALISFIDAENLRILNGLTAAHLGMSGNVQPEASRSDVKKSASTEKKDEALLFGENVFESVGESSGTDESFDPVDEEAWLDILGDKTERDRLGKTDPNAWSYLLVKLSEKDDTTRVLKELNSFFDEAGIEARAWKWIEGAGSSAALAEMLQQVFNILMVIVAVVAVIIIMNTLVISVTERFGEIGTMRAIGAKRSFVRNLIIQETLLITVVFGAIGTAIGGLVLWAIRRAGIEAGSTFMQILLGSGVFRPSLSTAAVLVSLLVVSFVGLVSSLYPVSIALKISPLQAMNRN
jgi:putative ABC transport system permease protein